DDLNKHLTIYAKLTLKPLPHYASDLMMTRYVEGAPGSRKAIQIFNGTGNPVNLTGYVIRIASNGGAWPQSGGAVLTGILQHGDVYVVATTDGGWNPNLTFSLGFNGNDAVGLFKNNVLIDVFGVQGEDPGNGWSLSTGDSGNDTVDIVVVRSVNTLGPSTTWNHLEWSVELAIPN